jgi:hypothetical protein
MGEVTIARLQLFEKPRVLDGNHCLIGKGRDQLNLFVIKWSHGCAGSPA